LNQKLRAKLLKLLEGNFFFRIVAFKERCNAREFMNGEVNRKLLIQILRTQGKSELNRLLNYLNSITGGLRNYDILY
jgi:hypothetical protein